MNRRSISCKVCIYFHGKLKNLIFSIFFIENSRWKYFWCLEIFSSSKTLKNFISFRFFFSFYHLFFIFQHFMGFDWPEWCELQIRWNLAHSFIEPFQKVSNVQKQLSQSFHQSSYLPKLYCNWGQISAFFIFQMESEC